MAETVRIGIIGAGQIGKQHLAEYAKIGGVEVVAAADIDVPELERVANLHAIPHRYTNFRDLLAREEITAVDVCVHNNLHPTMTLAALHAGKHVYCEKPMAGSYKDAQTMLATAHEVGKMLNIQLATLFTKETKIAKHLIDAGRLGKLYHARSEGFRRRGRPFVDGYGSHNFVNRAISGGGALFDMGVYHIAQILYLLGHPTVERISGKVYQETSMDAERRAHSGYNVEELATGYVRCAGGLTIDIIESWAIHLDKFAGSCLLGSEGGLRLNPLTFHTTLNDVEANMTLEVGSVDWRWHQLQADRDAYDSPQRHWSAVLQGRVPLLPSAELALTTMLISEGIYLSDRLGREVTREEIEQHAVSTAIAV